jgi:hypothetical protein
MSLPYYFERVISTEAYGGAIHPYPMDMPEWH